MNATSLQAFDEAATSLQRLGHRSPDRNGPYPADFGCNDDYQDGDGTASAAHQDGRHSRPPIGPTQF